MTEALKSIVGEFETAVLRAVAAGGDESDIDQASDEAHDRLRAAKVGADDALLEAIFAAALEIGTKADMAKQTVAK